MIDDRNLHIKYKSTGCELLREIREKIPEKMKKNFLENICIFL